MQLTAKKGTQEELATTDRKLLREEKGEREGGKGALNTEKNTQKRAYNYKFKYIWVYEIQDDRNTRKAMRK